MANEILLIDTSVWLFSLRKNYIPKIKERVSHLLREERVYSLKEILGAHKKEGRSFSVKEQLFNANQTCAICEQRIHTIDDSEFDHIDFYWRGGKSIPSNARLVHRYCNRARGGR